MRFLHVYISHGYEVIQVIRLMISFFCISIRFLMPYYRRYNNRRYYGRRGRRNNYYPSRSSANTSMRVARLERNVKRLSIITAPEKKFFDVAATGQLISTSPSFHLLNAMVSGAGSLDRLGVDVNNIYSYISFDITIASAASGTAVRMFLLYDTQANGVAPTGSDVLESSTNLNSPLNLDNSHRFVILWDERFNLSSLGSNYQLYKKKFKRLTGYNTHYNTTNLGTVADIATGSLYLVYMSDETSGNRPTLSFYHRLRFSG